jgi:N-acetylglucosamine-6-phosphate deacetylase
VTTRGRPAVIAVSGARVVTGGQELHGRTVVVRGRTISDVTAGRPPPDAAVLDAGGARLCTGFVDLHVHGALGRSFDEPDSRGHVEILRHHAAGGTVAVLATLISAPRAQLSDALTALAATRAGTPPRAAELLGAHLEGPFLNEHQRGAHRLEHLAVPGLDGIAWLRPHLGVVRMLTLAPELPGALELVRRLSRSGMVLALGHSEADVDDLEHAMQAGARHVVHLWSGQSTVRRRNLRRVPGLLESTLAGDLLTAEIIADGRHLPPELIRIAHRCLSSARLCAVSDASPGTGLPDGGRYEFGGSHCVVSDGVGVLRDGSSLAGAARRLGDALPFLVARVGLTVPDAVTMLTATPARIAGAAGKGSVAPGADADLVLLDDDLGVRRTMIAGRWLDEEAA